MTIEELERQTKNDFDVLESEKSRLSKENDALDIKTKKYSHYGRNLIYMGFAAFLLPIICLFIPYDIKLNEYGDYAGGVVASLWSLAGFVFIYVAFLAQKQQLMMQQFELKHTQFETKSTRLEIMKQEAQMKEQNETLYLQRFENTFHSMLSIHHQIINSLAFEHNKGRDALVIFHSKLMLAVKDSHIDKLFVYSEGAYKKIFDQLGVRIEHYFNDLLSILLLIDESDLLIESERKTYFDIVTFQLAGYEKVILFYHIALSDPHVRSNKIFKELEKKRKLFFDIDISALAKEDHYKFMFYSSIY